MLKRIIFAGLALLLSLSLTGCNKKDEALEEYRTAMTEFTEQIDDLVSNIEKIDSESDTRIEELLGYLDEMNEAFAEMSRLEVPEQFVNNEDLAVQASENLSEAVSLYHQAFDYPENYDENLINAALEYYERAFKRLEYMSIILQGELPEDETITIIDETDLSD